MLQNTKPALLLLLGAGASMDCGVPGTMDLTKGVWQAIEDATAQRSAHLWSGDTSQPQRLRSVLDQAYPPAATFEHVLHALEALASLSRTWQPGTASMNRMVEGVVTGGMRSHLVPCYDPTWVTSACDALITRLGESVRASGQRIVSQVKWPEVRGFLEELRARFDLYVVTTNYDTLVEQAFGWGAAEQGLGPVGGETVCRFNRHVTPPPRPMHLHGSVCFGYRCKGHDPNRFAFEDEPGDLYLHDTPVAAATTWLPSGYGANQAGRIGVVGPLVTGLEKPAKLLVEPYASYMRWRGPLASRYGYTTEHKTGSDSRTKRGEGCLRARPRTEAGPGRGICNLASYPLPYKAARSPLAERLLAVCGVHAAPQGGTDQSGRRDERDVAREHWDGCPVGQRDSSVGEHGLDGGDVAGIAGAWPQAYHP